MTKDVRAARHRSAYIALLTAAAGAALAHQARAEDFNGPPAFDQVWQAGGFYGTLGGRYERRGIGPVSTWRFFTPGSPHLTLDPDLNLGGPSGAIGFAFRDGSLPAWLGSNVRLELSGGWASGTGYDNAVQVFPTGTQFSVASVSGFSIGLGTLGDTLNETASVRVTAALYRARLRIAGDFPIAPDLVLSPYVGAAGGHTQVKYSLAAYETFLSGSLLTYVQNTKISWSDIGGSTGARLTYSALPWLQLHASGFVDFVHRRASLRADDCGSGPMPSFTAPCAGNLGIGFASASANRFAVIGGGEVGFTIHGGFYRITIAGGAEHDTHVPAIRFPTPAAVSLGTGTPAALRFLGQTSFNASARLTLKF